LLCCLRHLWIAYGLFVNRNILVVWLLVFIAASYEVGSSPFLYGPRTRTMPVMFVDLAKGGRVRATRGVTAILFVAVGQAVSGRDFMLQRD
jgi:ABC-type Fe3+ transport system permease subunit